MKPATQPRKLFFVIISWMMGCIFCSAQEQSGLKVVFHDSLKTTEGTQLLTNNILIINKSAAPASIRVALTLPSTWRLVGNASGEMDIPAGDSAVFPVNLVKGADAPAQWVPVMVDIVNKKSSASYKGQFVVSDVPIFKYRVTVADPEVFVRKEDKEVFLEMLIQNTGNLDDKFDINSGNSFFGLVHNQRIRLRQGESYKARIPIKITTLLKEILISQQVEVNIYSSTRRLKLYYKVNKLTNEIKKNPSAYPVVPVELESGLMTGANMVTAFVAFRGEAKLKDSVSKIRFGYRSKQFGMANTIEQNAFQLGYSNKKWDLYAGELADARHFFTFGQGFSVTHFAKKNVEMGVKAIFHYRISPIKSDLFSAYVKHNWKKVTFNHSLSLNTVKELRLNSFILFSEAQVFNTSDLKLKLSAATGQDHFMLKLPGTPEEKAGTFLGYDFFYSRPKWSLASNFQQGSRLFPGNFSQSKMQNHTLNFNFSKLSFGLFYLYNDVSNKNFVFRDSVFLTDFLSLNMEQAGVMVSKQFGKVTTSINTGVFRQTNMSSSEGLPEFKFGEINASYMSGTNLSVHVRSFAGFSNTFVDKNGRKAITLNNSLRAIFKYGGFNFLYIRVPNNRRNGGVSGDTLNYIETMSIAPSVRINFIKNVKGLITYSIAKTVLDSSMTVTFLNTNFTYDNKRNGLEVRVNGGIPIKNSGSNFFSQTGSSNLSVSVIKKLNMPVPVRKKYFTLELHLFLDGNNNGKWDTGETPMANSIVKIGNHYFSSDRAGKVYFRHIPSAFYAVDLSMAKTEKGIIPAYGYRQFPQVKQNTTLLVPFQRGKIIEGKIIVTTDKNSTGSFPTDGLKIVVSDSTGNYYTTLTDAEGGFFLSVPPGQYKVSMKPESFTGTGFQPVQMSYTINITDGQQAARVNFEIKQRTRLVNYLKE